MQIHFFVHKFKWKVSSLSFPSSLDFKTREFIKWKKCFNKHMRAAPEYLTAWDGRVHPEAVLINLYIPACAGGKKKRRHLSGALCFDVGKSLTWGTELWVNDGDEWNTNLGLVPDNNRCVAKAFISISEFHLEIQAAFGNSFIRQLWHLMSVSTQLC